MNAKIPHLMRPLRSARRGAVTVEFAIIAPIMIVITLGLVEVSRLYSAQMMLISAAREAARFAAMDKTGIDTGGQSSNAKVIADVKATLAAAGIPANKVQVYVTDHETGQAFNLDDPANDLRLFDVMVKIPYGSVGSVPTPNENDFGLSGKITFRNARSVIVN